MNTPAIHQAIRFNKHPEELSWLALADSDLPEGISDLLVLCASKNKLKSFAENNNLDYQQLSDDLYHFIETVIVNEDNSDEKILATHTFASSELQKYHHGLLMNIFQAENNFRPNTAKYSEIVSNAYQRLKKKEQDQEIIRFSEHRKSSKNHYQIQQKATTNLSYTKSAIALVSALTIFTIVSMAGKAFNPELNDTNNIVQADNSQALELMKVTSVQSNANPIHLEKNSIQASSSELQKLLKNLEVAYEKGDVSAIKPILANTPDTENQTEKELSDKLETLFEITAERKMVLFDFKWKDASGKLQGEGRFLSRYQLVGEKEWLTREGTAMVLAVKNKNNFKITQLVLENQPIE